jgi:hypothetical protein
MSLFARILPALATAVAVVAVLVGMALPASPGAVRLAASGTVLTHSHHWHHSDWDDDDYYDNSHYDHSNNNNGDDGLLVLHDLL